MLFYVQTTRQPSRLEDNQPQQIAYAAEELGHKVIFDQYKFFDDNMDLSFLPTDELIVFHGSIGTALQVKRNNLPYHPFAWFDEQALLCKTYYEPWKDYLLNENYGFYNLKHINDNLEQIAENHGVDGYFFIRPDTNDKAFTGGVVCTNKFDFQGFKDDLVCVVAKPKRIWAEFRTVVSNGKFISGSQYKDGSAVITDPFCPDGLKEFAEKVAQTWGPHPIYCLDIAETADGFKVIECGSVNCAGYYRCDIHKIVGEMCNVALSAV